MIRIAKEEIIEINKRLGGGLRTDGSIEFALQTAKDKNIHRQASMILRAILVDHPFTDYNKRTAFVTVSIMYKRNKTPIQNIDGLKRLINKVSKKNITSLINVERRLRYVAEGH